MREEKGLEQLVAQYEELAAWAEQSKSSLETDLADVRQRVMEIERMLREVDQL